MLPWDESGGVVSAVVEDAVLGHEVLVLARLFGGDAPGGIVDKHGLGGLVKVRGGEREGDYIE